MFIGELTNFAAYSFASAMLVTPLGALSVIVSAILGLKALKERLKRSAQIGVALCILGSLLIVLHAPPERQIESIQQIIDLALSPLFVTYTVLSLSISVFFMIFIAPIHGRNNILVYICICSLIGSLTVMLSKAFGIAIRLTISGKNQFAFFSTYLIIFALAVCVVIQLKYFNRALDAFSTSLVTPIYYVFFTTATIVASLFLFQGFYDTNAHEVISALSGFFVIFIGVYLLCKSPSEITKTSKMVESHEFSNLRNSYSKIFSSAPVDDVISSHSKIITTE